MSFQQGMTPSIKHQKFVSQVLNYQESSLDLPQLTSFKAGESAFFKALSLSFDSMTHFIINDSIFLNYQPSLQEMTHSMKQGLFHLQVRFIYLFDHSIFLNSQLSKLERVHSSLFVICLFQVVIDHNHSFDLPSLKSLSVDLCSLCYLDKCSFVSRFLVTC